MSNHNRISHEITAASVANGADAAAIVELARTASLEMSVHDIAELDASREWLVPGTRMYVSHLPRQAWSDTIRTCIAAHEAGCDAIPHIPVRCLQDREAFESLLHSLVTRAEVQEVLLIAGDYANALGPFDDTMSALRTGLLAKHGIHRLSVAGHPEGHPNVSASDLRRVEVDKIRFALDNDLSLTFLTQFFFDAAPYVQWRRQLQIDDSRVRVVAGLAGPARLSTLFRYAVKCGVGPSLRALGARPTSFAQLIGDRGPESLVLAIARSNREMKSGIHLYSFGGLTRTCAWLAAVRSGKFKIDDNGAFAIRGSE